MKTVAFLTLLGAANGKRGVPVFLGLGRRPLAGRLRWLGAAGLQDPERGSFARGDRG